MPRPWTSPTPSPLVSGQAMIQTFRFQPLDSAQYVLFGCAGFLFNHFTINN